LTRIESHAFDRILCTIGIPWSVLFVAFDLGLHTHQLLLSEGDSCEELDGWLRVKKSGISVDFRRILMFVSGNLDLRSHQLDDSVIEEMSLICESAGIES
jgi:hypothetical protein